MIVIKQHPGSPTISFLGLKRFHSGERGAFYDRIALNLHIHMKDKVNAIKVCHVGIEDPMVPNKHKLMLQIRAQKIFKKYPVVIELAKFETVGLRRDSINF